MNLSDVWDWTFFWQMVRNFTATAAPFVMIFIAIAAVGLLLHMVVNAVVDKRRG